MKINLLAAMALLVSISVHAQTPMDGYKLVEVWRCYDIFNDKKMLVQLTRETLGKREAGVVTVAGIDQLATFMVAGFNRRWDFVDAKYTFIIHPDGDGFYYDMTRLGEGETTTESQRFRCVMQ